MKKSLVLSSGTAVILGSLVIPSIVQTADAASDVSIQTVTFEHEGTQFTFPLKDFGLAVATQSGEFYDFYSNSNPTIKSVGLSNGDFINFRDYAKSVTYKDSSETVQDVINKLAEGTDAKIAESTVSTYQTVNGYDSNGEPVFDEAETPEVISID